MKILTSVIGSYPPFDAAGKPVTLEQAIDAQLAAGIEVVTDGQTSGNMIEIFASKIGGIKARETGRKKTYEITGTLKWPHYGIIIGDQIDAKELIKKRSAHTKLKGVVTGPYTLAKDCKDSFYKNERRVALEFARILNIELGLLQQEVDVFQIDEPYFFGGVPEYMKDVFDVLTESVSKEIILHTHYGRTTWRDLPEILALPVQTISYDSAANPIVIDLLAKHRFKQTISVGCMRTDGDYLTNVGTIENRIKRAVRILGIDRIKYATPDCGLRERNPSIAGEMMRRVVAARNRLSSS